MFGIVRESLLQAVLITAFVFTMMAVIEYLNVLSAGIWQSKLRGNRWRQYVLCGLLGSTPGCLGAYAVAALYAHRVVGIGAVVAAMIATSGDEAFVMLAMFPGTAAAVFGILLVVGIAAGWATDAWMQSRSLRPVAESHTFDLHESEVRIRISAGKIYAHWRRCSSSRALLAGGLLAFLVGVAAGWLGDEDWDWIRISLLASGATALFIVATVPDHFLRSHLWEHLVLRHVPRIFAWSFGALLVMHLALDQFHMQGWIEDNRLVVLGVACLIGLVPESGPHLIFVTLYFQHAIPLSVLLASSTVQDGHGMLPILADSRKDFLRIKAINLAVGLGLGLLGYFTGW